MKLFLGLAIFLLSSGADAQDNCCDVIKLRTDAFSSDGSLTLVAKMWSPYEVTESATQHCDFVEIRSTNSDGSYTVLNTRNFARSHPDEQPFSRTVGGIFLPEGSNTITAVGHDSLNGYCGKQLSLTIVGNSPASVNGPPVAPIAGTPDANAADSPVTSPIASPVAMTSTDIPATSIPATIIPIAGSPVAASPVAMTSTDIPATSSPVTSSPIAGSPVAASPVAASPVSDEASALSSALPSMIPSSIPSMIPSKIPSSIPSLVPSLVPSGIPSVQGASEDFFNGASSAFSFGASFAFILTSVAFLQLYYV